MKKIQERAGQAYHVNGSIRHMDTHSYRGCECAPEDRTAWCVLMYRCNYSAFNGRHHTPSDYSQIGCVKCRKRWRTKAAYVETLVHMSSHAWEESKAFGT